jgi:hypothetical protein
MLVHLVVRADQIELGAECGQRSVGVGLAAVVTDLERVDGSEPAGLLASVLA